MEKIISLLKQKISSYRGLSIVLIVAIMATIVILSSSGVLKNKFFGEEEKIVVDDSLKIKKDDENNFSLKTLSDDTVKIGKGEGSDLQLELNKWNEVSSFKINIPVAVGVASLSESENKLSYLSDDGKSSVEFYTNKPETLTVEDIKGNKYEVSTNQDGGVEFDTILNENPISNETVFPIETKNLKFYYQPALNEEDQNKDLSCTETTCWDEKGNVVSFRSENVVGSYAVYYDGEEESVSSNDYKTGKAFHIYRPKVVDAVGSEIWGEMKIDEEKNTLTITVNQGWLDKAVYPVRIDPSFGYDTVGASEALLMSGEKGVFASKFSPTKNGRLIAIHSYGYGYFAAEGGDKWGIYESSLKSLATSTSLFDDGAIKSWWSDEIPGYPEITAGTDYWLAVSQEELAPGGGQISYDTGDVIQGFSKKGVTVDDDISAPSYNKNIYSIWAQYGSWNIDLAGKSLLSFEDKYVKESSKTEGTNSLSLVDDVEAIQTFTLDSSKTVLAFYQAVHNNGASLPSAGFQTEINIDGVGKNKSASSPYSIDRASENTSIWVGTLGAGNHTIKGQFASLDSTDVADVNYRVLAIYVFDGDAFIYQESSVSSVASKGGPMGEFSYDPEVGAIFTPPGSSKALYLYNTSGYSQQKIAIKTGGVLYGEMESSGFSFTATPSNALTSYVESLPPSEVKVFPSIAYPEKVDDRAFAVLLFDDNTLIDWESSDILRNTDSNTFVDDPESLINRTTEEERELITIAVGTKKKATLSNSYGFRYGVMVDGIDRSYGTESPYGGTSGEGVTTLWGETLSSGVHTVKGRFANNMLEKTVQVENHYLLGIWMSKEGPSVPAPDNLFVNYPSAQTGVNNPEDFVYSTPFFSAANRQGEEISAVQIQLTKSTDTGYESPVWDSGDILISELGDGTQSSVLNGNKIPDIFYGMGNTSTGILEAGENYIWRIKTKGSDYSDWSAEATIEMADDSLTARFYSGEGDGRISSFNFNGIQQTAWNNAHDASSGVADYGTSDILSAGGSLTGNYNYNIYRTFIPVDTSYLPDSIYVNNASLNVYAKSIINGDNDGKDWINLVQASQVSNSQLAGGDFDQCGSINNPIEIASRIDFGDITPSSYNNWALNIVGTEWVSRTGYTKLGLREGHDCLDDYLVGANTLNSYFSEQAGISNDPYLEVTYSNPLSNWSGIKTFGWTGTDERGFSVFQTVDEGYIIGGSAGDKGGLVVKLNKAGNQEWSKTYSDIYEIGSLSVKPIDGGEGGYIMVGPSSPTGKDLSIIKINKSGDKEWSKVVGGGFSTVSFSVIDTIDEGYILAGHISPTSGDLTDSSALIIKLDSNGNKVWAKTYGEVGRTDAISSIKEIPSGGYMVGGWTSSSSINPTNNLDLMLMKLDSNGNQVWAKTYGGNLNDVDGIFSFDQTTDGGYIMVGRTHSFANNPDENALVVKVDSNGNQVWSKVYGGDYGGWDHFSSVVGTTDGGSAIVGSVSNETGDDDEVIMKLDSNGDSDWIKSLSGIDDINETIIQTTDGGYVTSGGVMESVGDKKDIIIAKIDSNGESSDCSYIQNFLPEVKDVSVDVRSWTFSVASPVLTFSSPAIDIESVVLGTSNICSVGSTDHVPTPPSDLSVRKDVGGTLYPNPTSFNYSTPFFSAIYNDIDLGDVASSYRIQLTSSDNVSYSSTVWDSGKTSIDFTECTQGSRCDDIFYSAPKPYGGVPILEKGKNYIWRIKFWDAADNEGLWSSNATIGMTSSSLTARFFTEKDGDGFVYKVDTDWDVAHDALIGTGKNADYSTMPMEQMLIASLDDEGDQIISRAFLPFNTSKLPDTATISLAEFKGKVDYASTTEVGSVNNYLSVVQGFQDSPLSLVLDDYDKSGDIVGQTDGPYPTKGSNDFEIDSLVEGNYNTWTLNGSGISWISKTGWTNLSMREGHDLWDDSLGSEGNQVKIYSSEQAGIGSDPYLEVTYNTGFTFMNTRPYSPIITGPTEGNTGVEYTFDFVATDNNGDSNGINLANIDDIGAGVFHTCAVSNDGNIYCWGCANFGKLGDGQTSGSSDVPARVLKGAATVADTDDIYLANIKNVGLGEYHTCAVSNGGNPYCWGFGMAGKLGDGGEGDHSTPVQVLAGEATGADGVGGLLSNMESIIAGLYHTCAVSKDGINAYCWGWGPDGQLGNNLNVSSSIPVQIQDGAAFGTINSNGTYLTNIETVKAGEKHTCALSKNGNVYCWGNAEFGKLGNDDVGNDDGSGTTAYLTPVRVLANGEVAGTDKETVGGIEYLANIKSIAVGIAHTCAVSDEGNVYCWGCATHGKLGNDQTTPSQATPVRVLSGEATGVDKKTVALTGYLANIKSINAGHYHTCAVSNQGNSYCWGSTDGGKLGNNDDSEDSASLTPVQVLAGDATITNTDGTYLTNIESVVLGRLHTCAISNDGNPYCWGSTDGGKLGNNENDVDINHATPIRVWEGAATGEKDDIRYGVDWDSNGFINNWFPSSATYVLSETKQSGKYSWSEPGVYYFQVIAEDNGGLSSDWVSYKFTVSDSPQCDDGKDNDLNLLFDENDPGCWTDPDDSGSYDPEDNDESSEDPDPACDDGFDNDIDGKTDFPDDPGCASAEDDNENDEPECSDGLDNDGDGLFDDGLVGDGVDLTKADPGCYEDYDLSKTYHPEDTDENTCGDDLCNGGETFPSCPSDCSFVWVEF